MFKSPESPYPPDHLARQPEKTNVPRPSIPDLVLGWKLHDGKFVENNEGDRESYLISKPDANGQLTPFSSTYERIAGGTGNHWMGTCLRMDPLDFRLRSNFTSKNADVDRHYGKDWPIGYKDLESNYKAVEKLIGVAGDEPDQQVVQDNTTKQVMSFEYPMPGIPKSYLDKKIAETFNAKTKTGKVVKIDDVVPVVTSTPAGRNSIPYQNRRVCHGNMNCTPICPIQAKYDPTVAISQALETGNVDIRYQHVVDYMVFDDGGMKVTNLNFITYKNVAVPSNEGAPSEKQKHLLSDIVENASGATIFLAANAIENVKIMLNSFKHISKPHTLTNSDSHIGKYLMDHPVYLAWGLSPVHRPIYGYRGPLSTGGIETGRSGEFRKDRSAWRIEIGNEGWNWPVGDPYETALDYIYGTDKTKQNVHQEIHWGKSYVKVLNSILTRQFRVAFLVEQDANKKSYIELSEKTDALGIPRVEIHYHISDYVKKGFKSARKAARELFENLEVNNWYETTDEHDVLQFKFEGEKYHYQGAGHVCGTPIMGEVGKSVVDTYQRCHSHENLYLVGCGSMPSVGTQNPTLTMLAMTDRTANHILQPDSGPK